MEGSHNERDSGEWNNKRQQWLSRKKMIEVRLHKHQIQIGLPVAPHMKTLLALGG